MNFFDKWNPLDLVYGFVADKIVDAGAIAISTVVDVVSTAVKKNDDEI